MLKSQTRAEALALSRKGQISGVSEAETSEDVKRVIGCLQVSKLSRLLIITLIIERNTVGEIELGSRCVRFTAGCLWTSHWRCSGDVGQLFVFVFVLVTQLLSILETDPLFSFWETNLSPTQSFWFQ